MKNELFWICFLIASMLIGAVALGEFLQWSDDKPEIRQQLYLD